MVTQERLVTAFKEFAEALGYEVDVDETIQHNIHARRDKAADIDCAIHSIVDALMEGFGNGDL